MPLPLTYFLFKCQVRKISLVLIIVLWIKSQCRTVVPFLSLDWVLNQLIVCKFFAKIDLKATFNLLWVARGTKLITMFHNPCGLFKYKVMSSCLENALASYFSMIVFNLFFENIWFFFLVLFWLTRWYPDLFKHLQQTYWSCCQGAVEIKGE